MGHSFHHPESYGPQSEDAWAEYMAEQAAADAEAERAYQQWEEAQRSRAELAAADQDAERYATVPPRAVEYDVL